jgi:hypothetical protein
MTDAELTNYLCENGYPEQVCRGGCAGLVERWRKFVAEVDQGYRHHLEDYRNDLDLRGVLSIAGLDDEVRDDDVRFEKLLTARDRRVWESAGADPFWDFGYPKNASGKLLKDLKSEGLIG